MVCIQAQAMVRESFITLPLSLLEASIDHPDLTIKRLVWPPACNRHPVILKFQSLLCILERLRVLLLDYRLSPFLVTIEINGIIQ
jgi:hypothetical protein